ncbi:hypothetical protein [Polaribacter marinaquae]|uniref:Lipoprotein n=1 Tax=Polaribacter marinaquae TaxID=1642819 RepID=A0ABZ2TU24_9FLAO
MKKINLIIVIIILCSCKSESFKNELPQNSATLLLKKRVFELNLSESSAKNIDVVNGFRGLKLGVNIDSLYLKDWKLNNYSSEINYYDKKLDLFLDNNTFKCEIYLTFYFNKLIMIDIGLNDNRGIVNEKYSESEVINTFIKPKLMELFDNVFGQSIKIEQGVISERKIKPKRSNSEKKGYDNFFLKLADGYDLIEITEKKFSSARYIKRPFELVINKYKTSKKNKNYKKNKFSLPGARIYYNNRNNKELYSYNGNKNMLKLFIENEFERNDSGENTYYISYKLKNIKTQIKVYNKIETKKYMLSKKMKDSINLFENNRKLKERKISKDSIKFKKSLENF